MGNALYLFRSFIMAKRTMALSNSNCPRPPRAVTSRTRNSATPSLCGEWRELGLQLTEQIFVVGVGTKHIRFFNKILSEFKWISTFCLPSQRIVFKITWKVLNVKNLLRYSAVVDKWSFYFKRHVVRAVVEVT